MKIYVASSWRNKHQPHVVARLSVLGHDVYDFRNPPGKDTGFHWSEIDPAWQDWTPDKYRVALGHPIAEAGFKSDMEALASCDMCILVLPSGRSAHIEAGYACGEGKKVLVYMPERMEPELMYLMCENVCLTMTEVTCAVQTEAGRLKGGSE